jgi:hypothetical protein
MSLQLDNLESNVRAACRAAGVDKEFVLWVKKITDVERMDMRAVGDETQDEFFGP